MMRQVQRFAWTAVIVFVGLVAPLAIAHPTHHHHPSTSAPSSQETISFAKGMEKSMEVMMADMHTAHSTGNPDIDFLSMMIPHHQGAIDMARLVLLHGNDPLVRQLAQDIIANQQAEITTMKGRLSVLKQGTDSNPDGFPSLSGTRGGQPSGRQ